MATPPFSINEALPADDDIVSQFPAAERTFRDVVEDWLLIEHNNYGRTKLGVGDDAARDALSAEWSDGSMWVSTEDPADVHLQFRESAAWQRAGSAVEDHQLLPVGIMGIWPGATAPAGWVLAFGQAVSRTTYADLFAIYGTTYGAGDGSTTFNLPDMRGRTVAGLDNMGGTAASRVTSATMTPDGQTRGATGGSQNITMALANLIQHNHTQTRFTSSGGGFRYDPFEDSGDQHFNYQTVNTGNAGSASPTPMVNMQPTLLLNWMVYTGVTP